MPKLNDRSRRSILALAFGAVAVMLGLHYNRATAHEPQVHPLSQLRFKTAWIHLGVLDVKSQKWASLLKHRIKARRSREASLVPVAGDILEVKYELELFIVAFQRQGEELRLTPPVGQPLGPRRDDFTGLKLSPGTEVLVLEVVRGGSSGPTQSVWARIGIPPETSKPRLVHP